MPNLRTLAKTIRIFFAIGFLFLTFTTNAHHTASPYCTAIYLPPPDTSFLNCIGVPWIDAFNEMHNKISKEYAFTDWRGIDWLSLHKTTLDKIVAAGSNEAAYYQALRDYFSSVHDGHVAISPKTDEDSKAFVNQQLSANIGGDYGLIITPTDDGKYIVSYLTTNGSAKEQGIKLGDEVVSWKNSPITQAIANEPKTWANETVTDQSSGKIYGTMFNPATEAGLQYEQTRLLTQDTIGQTASITVFRPSTNASISATLDARNDQMQTLNLTNLYAGVDLNYPVTHEILQPSNFGYLKIVEKLNDSTELATVQAAVTSFVNSHVPDIIIDVRGNIGGDDQMAASIAGFFYVGQKKLYESTTYYDSQTGKFVPMPLVSPPVYVVPTTPSYQGQIIILTNLGTISSGEGIPMALKNQSNVHILSFAPNTHGAFGMSSSFVALSGNSPNNSEIVYFISYPDGRSLDKNNQIQVDANASLQGGVATDIIIPMNAATAIDTYTNGKDMALAYAINCLQTSCWAAQSSGSSSRVWETIAEVAAGVAAVTGGVYLAKQKNATSTSRT